MEIDNDEWLTTKEAARYMKTTEGHLRNKVSMGQIPYYKFGRSNRYKKKEIENLLNSEPRGINGNQARRKN